MKKLKLIILTVLVLITCGLAVGFFGLRLRKVSNPSPSTLKISTSAQQQQTSADNATKKRLAETGTNTPASTPNPIPVTPSNQVDLSAKEGTDGNVTVFTKISGLGNGTCTLSVTNGSKLVSQSADVIYQPQYSSCAGFSVPINNLGTGTWTISLTVKSGSLTISKSISQVVE